MPAATRVGTLFHRVFRHVLGAAALVAAGHCATAVAQPAWTSSGNGPRDMSAMDSPAGPNQLNPTTVAGLKVKWFFPIRMGGSSTPTVEPGGLY